MESYMLSSDHLNFAGREPKHVVLAKNEGYNLMKFILKI